MQETAKIHSEVWSLALLPWMGPEHLGNVALRPGRGGVSDRSQKHGFCWAQPDRTKQFLGFVISHSQSQSEKLLFAVETHNRSKCEEQVTVARSASNGTPTSHLLPQRLGGHRGREGREIVRAGGLGEAPHRKGSYPDMTRMNSQQPTTCTSPALNQTMMLPF